jgi:hypothetical protein
MGKLASEKRIFEINYGKTSAIHTNALSRFKIMKLRGQSEPGILPFFLVANHLPFVIDDPRKHA